MSFLVRVLLYVPILYLVMIVYVGQRHDNASLRTTGDFERSSFVIEI